MKQRLFICALSFLFWFIIPAYTLAEKPNEQKSLQKSESVKLRAQEKKAQRLQKKELKNKLNALEKEKAELKDNLSARDKENANLKNKLNVLEKENKSLENFKDKLSASEKERGAFKNRIGALERENELLRIQMDTLNSRLKSFKERQISEGKRLTFQEAASAKKNSHYNLGYLYAQKGEVDKAIKEYQRALKYAPNDKDSHYNLGCLYARKGDFEEAIGEFQTVLSLDPNDRETYYNLASIYHTNLKDTQKAESYYQKFLEQSPQEEKKWEIQDILK